MARASLTITGTTADALRAAKPALSYAAGHMLTVDGCVGYLLNYWLQNAPEACVLRQATAAEVAKAAPAPRRKNAARGQA